jgi:hypothetical protein
MRNITARPHPLSIHKNDKSISKAQHLPSINDPINISISLNQCRFVDQDSNFCATALLQFHKKKSAPVDILQYPISIIYITYIYNYIYISDIRALRSRFHLNRWISSGLSDCPVGPGFVAADLRVALRLRFALVGITEFFMWNMLSGSLCAAWCTSKRQMNHKQTSKCSMWMDHMF